MLIRLGPQLRGTRIAIAGSDTRLFCKPASVLTYPDVVAFAEDATFLSDDEDTLTDATFIAEVLSPSTRNFDQGEKFRCYRGLPSFAEYLLVEQDEVRVEQRIRQTDGSWVLREWSGVETKIVLESIGCRFRLSEIYSRAKI